MKRNRRADWIKRTCVLWSLLCLSKYEPLSKSEHGMPWSYSLVKSNHSWCSTAVQLLAVAETLRLSSSTCAYAAVGSGRHCDGWRAKQRGSRRGPRSWGPIKTFGQQGVEIKSELSVRWLNSKPNTLSVSVPQTTYIRIHKPSYNILYIGNYGKTVTAPPELTLISKQAEELLMMSTQFKWLHIEWSTQWVQLGFMYLHTVCYRRYCLYSTNYSNDTDSSTISSSSFGCSAINNVFISNNMTRTRITLYNNTSSIDDSRINQIKTDKSTNTNNRLSSRVLEIVGYNTKMITHYY